MFEWFPSHRRPKLKTGNHVIHKKCDQHEADAFNLLDFNEIVLISEGSTMSQRRAGVKERVKSDVNKRVFKLKGLVRRATKQ